MGIGSSQGSNRAPSRQRRGTGSNVRPSRVKPRRSRPSEPTTTTIVPTVVPPPPRRIRRHHHPPRPPMILPPISLPFPMQSRISPSSAYSPLYNSYSPYGYQPGIGAYPSMMPRSIPVAVPPIVVPPAAAAVVPPISVPSAPPPAPPIYYPPASGWTPAGQVFPNYNIAAAMPVQTAFLPRISRNLYTDWTGGGAISPGFLGPPL